MTHDWEADSELQVQLPKRPKSSAASELRDKGPVNSGRHAASGCN